MQNSSVSIRDNSTKGAEVNTQLQDQPCAFTPVELKCNFSYALYSEGLQITSSYEGGGALDAGGALGSDFGALLNSGGM